MTKPRVWIVSELYYPDAQATSKILSTLAEGLTSEYDVRVVCGSPTMQFDPPVKAKRSEVHHNVSIRRVHSTHLDKSILIFRIINLLTISIPVFIHLLLQLRRSDRVLVVTNPPVMPFIAVLAAIMRGASCLVLTHDVYPDVLLPTMLLRSDGLIYRFLRRMTGWMLIRTQGVVALGRDMAELLRSYVGSSPVPVRIIPNWSEPDRITPQEKRKNRVLRERALEQKFVVLYAGTMGRTHGIEDVLEAARRSRSRPDIHFIFAGVGVKRHLVERVLGVSAGDNLSLLPFLDVREQNDLLNACDVAIIAMIPGMCGISVPSRMYNTMASAKPIIGVTDVRSELAQVITEERIGWVVEPHDVDAIVRAVDEARARPDLVEEMGRRARLAAESTYTAERSISALRKFLGEIALP